MSRTERAAGIPLNRYRPAPRQRRPHPPDRGRVIALSNDARYDPRRPFWMVGDAADAPGEADRRWHAAADALWAGEPPDDGASRIPAPAVRLLAGADTRRRENAQTIVPLAVSWDRGRAADSAGVVWFSDGSTLPLESYLALLHHAGARAGGAPPQGTVTWTAAPGWPLLQAELDQRRIAALVRLKRSPGRDAEAVAALTAIAESNSDQAGPPGRTADPQSEHTTNRKGFHHALTHPRPIASAGAPATDGAPAPIRTNHTAGPARSRQEVR
ncbi:MAG: hypothetical protein OXG72_12605 [Acidobacteria bacterium]|nr:hypothetical protein [Acidobacteriota bacterium]